MKSFSEGDLSPLNQPLPGATPDRPGQNDHRHRQVDVSLSSCGLCLWLWDDPAVVVLCRPRDESLLQVPTQQTTKEKKKRPNLAPVYLVARLISKRRRRLAPSGEDLQTSGRQARSNMPDSGNLCLCLRLLLCLCVCLRDRPGGEKYPLILNLQSSFLSPSSGRVLVWLISEILTSRASEDSPGSHL